MERLERLKQIRAGLFYEIGVFGEFEDVSFDILCAHCKHWFDCLVKLGEVNRAVGVRNKRLEEYLSKDGMKGKRMCYGFEFKTYLRDWVTEVLYDAK